MASAADDRYRNDLFNAADYGLKTTNTGAANHAALLATQTACTAAGGGTLFIPAGTYDVDQDFLPDAHTTVCGERNRSVLRYTGVSAGKLIRVDARDHVTVRDLKLDLLNAALPSYGVAIMSGSSYAVVDHIWVVNAGQYGIIVGDLGAAGGSDGVAITNNFVDMTAAATDIANTPIGIEVFPRGGPGFYTTVGIRLEGNIVLAGTACITGIKVSGQTGGTVLRNFVVGPSNNDVNTTGSFSGVGNRQLEVAHNVSTGAKVGFNFGGNIDVDSGNRNSSINLHHNHASDFNRYGIFASDGLTGFRIESNMLEVGTGSGMLGIRLTPRLTGFEQLVIVDNDLIGGGIQIDGLGALQADGASITNNRIYHAVANGINATGNDLDVTENFIRAANKYGVLLAGDRNRASLNIILDGNQSNTPEVAGIAFVGTNPTAIENHIENADGRGGHLKYGISMNHPNDATLRDNRIVGMEIGQRRPNR